MALSPWVSVVEGGTANDVNISLNFQVMFRLNETLT